MWIDTHAHLEDPKFAQDLDEVMKRAERTGVGAILTAGVDLETSRRAVELADRYRIVWAAVGVHPSEAGKATPEALTEVRELAGREKVVAIGEVGLDFYRDHTPRELQLKVFREQARMAEELDLPLVVHTRGAIRDALEVIREFRGVRGVLHCFPGGPEEAREAIELGWYIGVGGALTFPRSRLSDMVAVLPLSHFLLETDSPFLAPVPHRGQRNEPAYISLVGAEIAHIKGLPTQEVARCTTENARNLFESSPISP